MVRTYSSASEAIATTTSEESDDDDEDNTHIDFIVLQYEPVKHVNICMT